MPLIGGGRLPGRSERSADFFDGGSTFTSGFDGRFLETDLASFARPPVPPSGPCWPGGRESRR